MGSGRLYVPPLRPAPTSALHPLRFPPHYPLEGFSLTGQQLALPPRYRAVLSPASAFTPVPFSVPTPAHLHAAASSMVSPAMWSALPIARKLFQRLAASTPGACWPCPLPGRTITNDENKSHDARVHFAGINDRLRKSTRSSETLVEQQSPRWPCG